MAKTLVTSELDASQQARSSQLRAQARDANSPAFDHRANQAAMRRSASKVYAQARPDYLASLYVECRLAKVPHELAKVIVERNAHTQTLVQRERNLTALLCRYQRAGGKLSSQQATVRNAINTADQAVATAIDLKRQHAAVNSLTGKAKKRARAAFDNATKGKYRT